MLLADAEEPPTVTAHPHSTAEIPATAAPLRRLAYAALAALLLAWLVAAVAEHGAWAAALTGALAADLSLAFGGGAGLRPGQLHPRAVPLYNAVHRFWGPLVVMTLSAADALSHGWFVFGLAWAFHVALDRSVGYGLRDAQGFQRGR